MLMELILELLLIIGYCMKYMNNLIICIFSKDYNCVSVELVDNEQMN